MKAIIFDCDGTLVDSEQFHYQAWTHALNKHNYGFSLEEYYPYVGLPSDITAKHLSQKLGKECSHQLKTDKKSHYKSLIAQDIPPIQDTLDFLLRLVAEKDRFKYKLAIASGASIEEILTYLKHLKIEEHFEVILSGHDHLHHYNDPEGVNKPKPYIYLEAAKQLGVDPSECIAIEDSCMGVKAGASAGCFTIAVPTPFSQNHDFSDADIILPSFKDISVENLLNLSIEKILN